MKIIITFLVFITVTFAGMVNGVAFSVNDDIVTLYDIDEAMAKFKISKDEAIKKLIIDKLKEAEIKKNNIDIDYMTLNQEAEKIANRNGMSLMQFKQYLSSRYISYDTYIAGLKEQLMTQKLISIIARDSITRPGKEEMEIYYQKNSELFSTYESVEVVEYTSANQESLQRAMQSPLAIVPDVQRTNKTLQLSTMDPQLKMLLSQTKEGSYTQIIPIQNTLVSYYVSQKSGATLKPFEESEDMILGLIMREKEQSAAQTYFEKLRNEANIKFIR